MSTPVTEEGLKQYDEDPILVAIARAWTEPGNHPSWHFRMQQIVRSQMPVLGRALDRLAVDYKAWQDRQDYMAKMFFRLDQTHPIVVPEELKPKAGEK